MCAVGGYLDGLSTDQVQVSLSSGEYCYRYLGYVQSALTNPLVFCLFEKKRSINHVSPKISEM